MKDIYKLIAVLIFAAVTIIGIDLYDIHKLKQDKERLENNQGILLSRLNDSIRCYKVRDSLNAVSVSSLELRLKEYKKYRAEDAQLIKELTCRNENLQSVITSQIKTINSISTKLSDSIRIDTITNIIDTLKHFDYKSKWTDVSGIIDSNNDSIKLQIKNRESLKVIETVEYKRFLGFLWKTSKIKNRQVRIISANPNTTIIETEYIRIWP